MASRVSSESGANSTSSLNRVIGVRRSWLTPASRSSRSLAKRFRSETITLKLSLTSRISLGPSRGSGCGKTPRPSSRAYSLSFARGSIKRLVKSTVNRAQMSSIPANQNIQLAPNRGFSAVRSARIQYSSPSISKLTHKPGMPFRL